jgi:Fe-S cluster biogenesis protein NfuA
MSESTGGGALRERVARVVAEEVAPLLQMDGGDIEVLAVEDGVVRVRLHGSCGCCPGSVQAVIMGIEDELRRHIPEVEYLEAVPCGFFPSPLVGEGRGGGLSASGLRTSTPHPNSPPQGGRGKVR